jgi:hypothetical protein
MTQWTGQSSVLHSIMPCVVGHASPFTERERVLVPEPQESEQAPQGFHGPTVQLLLHMPLLHWRSSST